MAENDTSTETSGAPSGEAQSGQAAPTFETSEAALRDRYPSMFSVSAPAPGTATADAPAKGGPEGQAPAAPATVQVEGFAVPADFQVDRETLGGLREIASTYGLSQESAQAVLDVGIKAAREEAAGYEGAFKDMRSAWVGELRSDPEFAGARGERWDKSLALARKAVAAFGNAALRQTFDELGIGDHPELVKFMAKIGAALPEDYQPPAAEPTAEPDEDAIMHSRYPRMFDDK